jgi:hypothetical protein
MQQSPATIRYISADYLQHILAGFATKCCGSCCGQLQKNGMTCGFVAITPYPHGTFFRKISATYLVPVVIVRCTYLWLQGYSYNKTNSNRFKRRHDNLYLVRRPIKLFKK